LGAASAFGASEEVVAVKVVVVVVAVAGLEWTSDPVAYVTVAVAGLATVPCTRLGALPCTMAAWP
jgi:hypothetical protein